MKPEPTTLAQRMVQIRLVTPVDFNQRMVGVGLGGARGVCGVGWSGAGEGGHVFNHQQWMEAVTETVIRVQLPIGKGHLGSDRLQADVPISVIQTRRNLACLPKRSISNPLCLVRRSICSPAALCVRVCV